MHSLVWKFLFLTWLAIALMLGATVLVVSQWHRFESYSAVEARPDQRLRQLADELQQTLVAGGDVARILRENAMTSFGTVYLIDPTGADYLNRPIPPEITTGKPAIASPQGSYASPPIFARAIHANGLQPYFMIFVFQHGSSPIWIMFRHFGLPWLVAASIVVSGLISALLAWLVVRPIKHLAQVSAHHSEGDFDAKADDRYRLRRDEIGDLARQLEDSAQQIQKLIHSQRELLRDVSHEVRAPLARLQLAAETVEADATDARALRQIGREVQTIDTLVQDLLHLSRVRGTPVKPLKPCDPTELLQGCEQNYAIAAERQQVEIALDTEAPAQTLYGDQAMLRRLLENLLDNAMRFSPKNGRIEVRAFNRQSSYCIRVRDQGPGVPEERLQDIFEPFVRIDPARQRNTGGFGVGLALVRNIATMHQGNVYARNDKPTGLAIEVVLPLGAPA